MKKCSVEGCERKYKCKELCNFHYMRLKRTGDVHFNDKCSFERLMESFNQDMNNKNICWEWLGRLTKSGYGHVFYKGSTKTAHRISYKYFKGEIPNKMNVCHICDNKKCFNPNHLWLGTTQDNIKDAYSKGLINVRKGSKNHYAKLKEHQIIEIRKLIGKGMMNTEIGALYQMSHQTISLIRHNKIWKHVKGE